jgi:hypothetical protein
MIKLTDLLEAEKAFTATSKETGNVSVFKTKAARDAAVKAGSHEKRKTDKDDAVDVPTGEKKPNMFSKDAGYDAPDTDKKEPKKGNLPLDDSGDGFTGKAASHIEDELSKSIGIDGSADINVNGTIEFAFGDSDRETSLFIGREGGTYNVSVENPYGDDFGGIESFDNEADAIAHAKKLAKKYSKELGAKSEKKTSEPKSSTPKLDKDGDGGMSSDTSRSVEKYLNKELGLDGFTNLNSGGAIEYNIPGSTDTLLIGDDEKDGKPFSVGLANEDGFDPGDTYKSFDNQKDAMAYAKELAQKLKDDKKDGPVKDSSGGRAGNPQVNKATRQKAKELGITPENLGREEYELKMVQAAHEALTDSNFHSEARKLIAIMEDNPELEKNPAMDPNKPGLGEPGYEDWVKTTAWGSKYGDSSDETDELGRAASNEAGWDGKDALDGIAFELKMRGFKDLALKIQSVFDNEKNEGRIKLMDLI